MPTLSASLTGQTFLKPNVLPSEGTGTPLTIVKALSFGKDFNGNADVSLDSILGVPSDLAPGRYEFQVEPRAKGRGKHGMSLWYVSHTGK